MTIKWSHPREPTNNDVLIMYFIVREALKMGAGKVGAQCAHACQLILQRTQSIISESTIISQQECNILTRMHYWNNIEINGGFRKVVLRANDKEWQKLKAEYGPIIICDAGLTEVAPGSETVMVLWPMYKNERDTTLKRLQCLI